MANWTTKIAGDIIAADHINKIQKHINWVVPEDYGAVGDGVTDDTTAIQAAIDSLTTGGVVVFANKTYKTTNSVSLKNNVRLVGTGENCIISCSHASNPVVTNSTGSTINFCGMEDIELTTSSTTAKVLYLNQIANSYFKGVVITGGATHGTRMGVSASPNSHYNTFVHCFVDNMDRGFNFECTDGEGGANENTLVGCHIKTCETGIYVDRSTARTTNAVRALSCCLEGNDTGAYIDGRLCVLSHCRYESCDIGASLSATSYWNTVDGGVFYTVDDPIHNLGTYNIISVFHENYTFDNLIMGRGVSPTNILQNPSCLELNASSAPRYWTLPSGVTMAADTTLVAGKTIAKFTVAAGTAAGNTIVYNAVSASAMPLFGGEPIYAHAMVYSKDSLLTNMRLSLNSDVTTVQTGAHTDDGWYRFSTGTTWASVPTYVNFRISFTVPAALAVDQVFYVMDNYLSLTCPDIQNPSSTHVHVNKFGDVMYGDLIIGGTANNGVSQAANDQEVYINGAVDSTKGASLQLFGGTRSALKGDAYIVYGHDVDALSDAFFEVGYRDNTSYKSVSRFDAQRAHIQFTGTTPSTSTTDAYKQYSADIVAGNAAPHFRTEAGDVVKLYRIPDIDFGITPNTGDADTDTLIEKLRDALLALGVIDDASA